MERIPFDPYDFFGYLASGGVVLFGMDLVFGFPKLVGHDFGVFEGLLVMLGAYVGGQIIASPAKALFEDFMVGKILDRPSRNLFREKKPWLGGILFPGFFKPLPKETQVHILDQVHADGFSGSDEALFLFVRYSQKTLDNERLVMKLDSFVNKYGFSRNLSFTCILVGLSLFVKQGGSTNPEATYSIAFLAVGVLLFYRYLKFFRQYSFEMFNAFTGKR